MPRDSYGQYCPVAKAAELIDQRWTLLVIRELVAGSTRCNDIHRGVPHMSRTLLSRRLRQLVADGFVERRELPDGPIYELTPAGHEFLKVIEALGEWGVRWIDSLTDEDLGFGIDVTLDTELRTVVRVWRGDMTWDDAVKAGRLRVRGLPALRRQVPDWFHLSYFAAVPRVAHA